MAGLGFEVLVGGDGLEVGVAIKDKVFEATIMLAEAILPPIIKLSFVTPKGERTDSLPL